MSGGGHYGFVNPLVFAGVLLAVYLAVETAQRLRLPRSAVLYGLAFLTGLRGGSASLPA